MKKIIATILVIATITVSMCGCASWDRLVKDVKSDVTNGLDRTITVYTADGKQMAQYKGKIDLEMTEGYVKFDYKGKRYMYYNCFVEAIENGDKE